MTRPTPNTPETSPAWTRSGRRRAFLYLLGALLLATLAAVLTFIYLDNVRSQSVPTAEAVVAVREIRPGTVITANSVELRGAPAPILPDGALTSTTEAVGRTAAFPIVSGEVVVARDLVGEGGAGISGQLPDGRWAMILPVGWLVSPVPPLASGDRLDIVAYQSGDPVEDAGVIVSEIEILSLPGEEGEGRLILAVTMEEAISILYSRSNGFQLLALLRPQGG